jgi:alanyl-tRNA synthetase
VLGKHVQQKGSNITSERLRFDFTHPQKLTEDEIKEVEDLVNEQIQKDLPVSFEAINLSKATKEGALAFFGEKYDQKVKVYTVGDSKDAWFSKEVCGGPHVSSTSEIGRVNIFRQDKIGAGIMRLYAKLE